MRKLILILLFLTAATLSGQNYYIGIDDPSCATCHADVKASWQQTLHSNALADGQASAFFGYSCLPCHTVGWDETVTNGGADEFVTAGDNNTYTVTDQAKWDRVINVQCESCHGPHGNSTGTGVDFAHISDNTVHDLSADVCGQCHTDVHHPTFENWSESLHAVSKFTSLPGFEFIASDPNCSACHTAEGFLQFLESEDLEPNVTAPGAEGNSITCVACHDPHSAENDAQLRLPVAQICQKCHNPEYDPDSPEPNGQAIHHSTAYMFEGKGGYEYAGTTYQSSAHKFALPEKCVTCHVISLEYQGGDPEIPAYTGHTFEPRAEACVQCHTDFDVNAGNFDYRGVQTEIKAKLAELKSRLDNASSSDSTSEGFLRAQFNYNFVNAEGSFGIHNTDYAEGLLESALANFNPVSVVPEAGLPDNYELSQNYPNPFNPTTSIKFSLPEQSHVRLVVYDAIGKEIDVLANQTFSAGNYKVDWNASNLASGIYLYKIITNDFIQTKKMLLMK